MIDELGPQCGFCTPGQIMSAVALLRVNPSPTRDEVRMALSGNLCRCGAYDHYREVMAKVLQRKTARSVDLGSINQDHPGRTIKVDDVDWMARIIWASQ
jgi:xanthine dehydrogenase iron-sulfur cluster and FAD-binding subunit A